MQVDNSNDFGVVEFDLNQKIKRIIEKPNQTESKTVVSGMYYYTNDVVNIAKNLKPSSRGELEITDINNYYLLENKLKLINIHSSVSWVDTGTYDSLIKASKYFQDYELNTGKKAACIEEIAFDLGLIDKNKLLLIAESMNKSNYGKYLLNKVKK